MVCSAKAKNVLSEYTEGLNTYRVKIIRIKDIRAEEVFEKVQKKKEVEREDLIPILLSPLMDGDMEVKERILQGIRLVQNAGCRLQEEEADKMQAVLYAFANKFLDNEELGEIKEAMVMTRLGQMLLEQGMERGKVEGITAGIKALTETCRELGVSRSDTLTKIKAKFQLGESDAEEYISKFWR